MEHLVLREIQDYLDLVDLGCQEKKEKGVSQVPVDYLGRMGQKEVWVYLDSLGQED